MADAKCRRGRVLALAAAFFTFTGCASSERSVLPTAARWGEVVKKAALSPKTWVPAAGAAVVAAGGWDDDISRWAVRESPVFGSPENARAMSDNLRTAAQVGAVLSALAVPAPEHPVGARVGRLGVHGGAFAATSGAALLLKGATGRDRPDGSNSASFPSGHTAQAFGYAALGSRNIDMTHLPPGIRTGARIGFTALAAGTAWARVEAGVHYPTDVLVGAALGNFLGTVIHDAFLGTDDPEAPKLSLELARGGAGASVRFTF